MVRCITVNSGFANGAYWQSLQLSRFYSSAIFVSKVRHRVVSHWRCKDSNYFFRVQVFHNENKCAINKGLSFWVAIWVNHNGKLCKNMTYNRCGGIMDSLWTRNGERGSLVLYKNAFYERLICINIRVEWWAVPERRHAQPCDSLVIPWCLPSSAKGNEGNVRGYAVVFDKKGFVQKKFVNYRRFGYSLSEIALQSHWNRTCLSVFRSKGSKKQCVMNGDFSFTLKDLRFSSDYQCKRCVGWRVKLKSQIIFRYSWQRNESP